MDKLFLLGLCVLYLSRGWGAISRLLARDYHEVEGVACHVCGRYINGRCYQSEDKCVIEIPSACQYIEFYWISNRGRHLAYTFLTCNRSCKEVEGVLNGMPYKSFCCYHDFCNKP